MARIGEIALTLTISLFAGMTPLALSKSAADHANMRAAGSQTTTEPAMSARYADLQWQIIVPELGADSPRIAILRVDPKTQATQLLIRVPKQMHVPIHWHSANETHTIIQGTWVFEHEGKQDELGPGGFNYLPAKMPHQAWSSDEGLVFITVDSAWDINWVSGPPTKADLGKSPSGR
jgi:mannose-6-phosphate isomerase-like protein (cupin superfamily)